MLKCEQVESVEIFEEVGGAAKPVSLSIWHARMGHLPIKTLKPSRIVLKGLRWTRFLMLSTSKMKYVKDV